MISTFFVRIKAATLFALIFGIPLLVMTFLVFRADNPTADQILFVLWFFLIFEGSLFLAWIFSVGAYLTRLKEVRHGFGHSMFRFGVVYLLVISWVNVPLSILVQAANSKLLSVVVLLAHVAGVLLIYYVVAHLAKLVVDAENVYRLGEKRFLSTFIALLLFPLGIWFVQPRINNIYWTQRKVGSD